MTQFDFEQFKAGRNAITRNGSTARFIAYVPECKLGYEVIILIEGEETCEAVGVDGKFLVDSEFPHRFDLVSMAPVRKTGYMMIYGDAYRDGKHIKECSHIYPTTAACAQVCGSRVGQIIKVEWDE